MSDNNDRFLDDNEDSIPRQNSNENKFGEEQNNAYEIKEESNTINRPLEESSSPKSINNQIQFTQQNSSQMKKTKLENIINESGLGRGEDMNFNNNINFPNIPLNIKNLDNNDENCHQTNNSNPYQNINSNLNDNNNDNTDNNEKMINDNQGDSNINKNNNINIINIDNQEVNKNDTSRQSDFFLLNGNNNAEESNNNNDIHPNHNMEQQNNQIIIQNSNQLDNQNFTNNLNQNEKNTNLLKYKENNEKICKNNNHYDNKNQVSSNNNDLAINIINNQSNLNNFQHNQNQNNPKIPGNNINVGDNMNNINNIDNNNISNNMKNQNDIKKQNMNINNMNNINKNNDINENNMNIDDMNNMNIINVNNQNYNNNINLNNMNNMNNMINNNMNDGNNMNNTPYSFNRYKKESKTGLKNIKETCYLNAVLRFIGSFRSIASYFLNPKNINSIKADIALNPLSFTFQRLFQHLYPYPETENRELYKPIALLELLGKLNKVYISQKRRNPNELLIFILNRLHQELNESNKKKNNYKKLNPNHKDKKNVIQCEFNNIKFNSTIISNNLSWFELKKMQCTNCGNILYNLFPYNVFELDINQTYMYKIKQNNSNKMTIYDCLKVYEFEKKQTLFCQNCRNYYGIINRNRIFSSPNYFIFSLDRKNLDNNLIKIPFIINEIIDLNNFIENKVVPTKYELTGIVSFNKKKNKYICFCISPVDKEWYEYNDEICEHTDLTTVLDLNNDIELMIPCILSYKSK